MTALAAVWSWSEPERAEPDCATILAAQASLGPDGCTQRTTSGIALGRQLWRLLPEDDLDRQVHVDPETGLALIADVRLDYPDELAASLGISGKACSDSYLVFAAYLRWGEHCVDRLYGDFAFVAWEERTKRLVMARDCLGGRPLFFHYAAGKVMVASLPRALAAIPGVCLGVDVAAFVDRLAMVVGPSDRTLWQNIRRLPPGHVGIADDSGVTLRRWWNPRQLPPVIFSRDVDYVEAGRAMLDQAVVANLRTRGAVGSHLSAGLDSGGITATAARYLAPRGEILHAFTARPLHSAVSHLPANRIYDESPRAAEVAQDYSNVRHHLVTSAGRRLIDDLDAWADISGVPFLNPVNIGWIDSICERARKHDVSILLTGAMGNLTLTYDGELFFTHALAMGYYRSWLRLFGHTLRRSHLRTSGRWLLKNLAAWLQQQVPNIFIATLGKHLMREPEICWNGLRDEIVKQNNLSDRYAQSWDPHRQGWATDSRARRSDFLQMPDFGVEQKATLVRHGLDARNPLLNRRLVEFSLGIPDEQYCLGSVPRSLARRVLADRLPDSVCQGQDRGAQGEDFHLHFRQMLPVLRNEVAAWEANTELTDILDTDRFTAYLERFAACDDIALARQNSLVNGGLLRNIAAVRFAHRTLLPLRDPR